MFQKIRVSPRAFTLVELLVVIGIVGLLISILLPALHVAREQAKAAACASNLRQLGIGLMMYANNNRGSYPAWSGWHVYPDEKHLPDDDPGLGWTEQLIPYFVKPDSRVYNCPSFPFDPRINYFLSVRWPTICGRRSLKVTDVKLTTVFVLSGDTTQRELYAPPFGERVDMHSENCDMDDATQEAILFWTMPGGMSMHRGGNNVLFADNHVALFRNFDPQSMTYHPRKMQSWESVTPD